jgi:hypothetical protein
MSENNEKASVLVVYEDYEQEEGAKGIWNTSVQAIRKVGILNTEELANNLRGFCKQMGEVFEGVTTAVKNYELKNVEIVVEITAKGEIKLIGSGMSSDIKGGIKLVFSKQNKEV